MVSQYDIVLSLKRDCTSVFTVITLSIVQYSYPCEESMTSFSAVRHWKSVFPVRKRTRGRPCSMTVIVVYVLLTISDYNFFYKVIVCCKVPLHIHRIGSACTTGINILQLLIASDYNKRQARGM